MKLHLRPLLPLLTTLLLLAASGCLPGPEVTAPADRSAVDASQPLVPVTIQLGAPLGAAGSLRVTLLAGIDTGSPSILEITERFLVNGSVASGALVAASDLGEGRNTLYANIDRDGDGVTDVLASSTFSYEPRIDAGAAAGCDLLDPGLCMYPFPSNFFTVADAATDTGLRVRFPAASTPRNRFGVPLDPTEWNRNDGFSPGPMIQTLVPGLDPGVTGAPPITDIARSLDADAPIVLIDAETGERQIFYSELDVNATPEQGRALFIRPARNLVDGRRYIVALRRMRDAAGAILPPGRVFQLIRDGIPTHLPAVEARRPHLEQVLSELEAAGVAREELYLAWDFTVISSRNLHERMLQVRDDAFDRFLDGSAPSFTVLNVDERPASDTRTLRRVIGTFQVPLYLTNGGASGSTRLHCEDAGGTPKPCEADELPTQAGSELFEARFLCVIPRSASADGGDPVAPARAGIYGHGFLGDAGEIFNGHVADMASEHNFVFCGTDWTGLTENDVFAFISALNDSSRTPELVDRLYMGLLNTLFLGRLMIHPDGFASEVAFQAGAGNAPVIDPSDLFFDGNSQGGFLGGAATALAQDWTRAVLGVAGMNFSMFARRASQVADFEPALGYAAGPDRSLVFGMIQMLVDRVETNGHANHLTRDPHPGTPAHKVLMHMAFGDFQVANIASETEARTIGAHIRQPALTAGKSNDVEPFFGIPPIEAFPFDGSAIVVWDSGNLAPPIALPPMPQGNPELSACALDHDEDPHECPRRQPSARLQKSEFLQTDGRVIEVCGSDPCLAPLP